MWVEQYASTTGVDRAEAIRRLELQRRLTTAADRIEQASGPNFAGLYIDNGAKWQAVAALADDGSGPDAVGSAADAVRRAASAKGLSDVVQTATVDSTWRQLDSTAAELGKRLAGLASGGRARLGIDSRANAVVLEVLSARSSGDDAAIRNAVASAPARVVVRPVDTSTLAVEPLACSFPNCDRPLRDGVRIGTPLVSCTSGFTSRSRTDGLPYLLTAGHCLRDDGGLWQARKASGDNPDIGPSHRYVLDDRGDAGTIRVASSSYWLGPPGPAPWMYVYINGTDNPQYVIHGDGLSQKGMFVCATSSFTGTKCGFVQSLDNRVPYRGGPVVDHLAETNICGLGGGSSGGPVGADGIALGMIAAGDEGQCLVYYQGIRGAEDLMNVDILTG